MIVQRMNKVQNECRFIHIYSNFQTVRNNFEKFKKVQQFFYIFDGRNMKITYIKKPRNYRLVLQIT